MQAYTRSIRSNGKLLPLLNKHCHVHSVRGLASLSSDPVDFSVPDEFKTRTTPYTDLLARLDKVRNILGTPLTLAEKIMYSHVVDPEESFAGKNGHIRGETYLKLNPDRVAMQDASAQMALLQFMTCGMNNTAVPASIHCDHLIVGHDGAEQDLKASIATNKEVFDFLQSCASKYGIQFWGPGSGIIHQIVLENFAAPGLMMLGTDSHTPNAGGLGVIAIGVGGADAVDALTGTPWELKAPKVLGVKLTGQLSGWSAPKDVITHLAGVLTVRGGTGFIIEYFGEGVQTLSCTGMATICNMGAEVGATTSTFPYTDSMRRYLEATRRTPIADTATAVNNMHGYLRADDGAVYDQIIEIDLSSLEPHINGPFTPDLSTPLSLFGESVQKNSWPEKLSAGLIGSCTNSSYQDMSRVASIVQQAEAKGLKPKVPFFITPGSEQIRATIENDGFTDIFVGAGAKVLANACGPCIGQWDRDDATVQGEANAILTSFNRNFRARNDGNPNTMNFLTSPEIVTAMIYSGDMAFNPLKDKLVDASGSEFMLSPPKGDELPPTGFQQGLLDYLPEIDPKPIPSTEVAVSPDSDRLALLDPFEPFEGHELKLNVLMKVKGKCTTDHISAAGAWLKYKGHLENISNNTLIGAMNEETGEVNKAYDFDGTAYGIPELMIKWKAEGRPWLVVAEHNYGEGSAREHAALSPRFLGGRMILCKSFARIHETNLKKQGILPLTFAEESDYDLIKSGDVIETVDLLDMLKNQGAGSGTVTLKITSKDGSEKIIKAKHTMSQDQVDFFIAGSAINHIGNLRRQQDAINA
ncbi:aconitase family-domain-containing protein [Lipomyces arxii]|uniref:aconitase family-domain-containing protein n=1 Tax=Lipomyces arxii TaxID=56418 RepID=UPI0034CD3C5C